MFLLREILFNPLPDNAEFIELYNRSAKVLNLSDLSIALADPSSGDVKHLVPLKDYPYLLFPGSYVVITRRSKELPGNCFYNFPWLIVEIDDLFTLPDEEGIIVLADDHNLTLDEFHYNVNMHTDLLYNTDGVSLERTDFDNPTSSPQNWHSASTSAGYSTPGKLNSQAVSRESPKEEVILQPEMFSPDNDGVDDYITLHLKLNEPGWMATIAVFDTQGRKIRDLASKILLGTDEYFTWDGISNDRRLSDPGIYLVFVEILNRMGTVKKIKKVVTIARRF